MATPILATKLYKPPIRPNLITRPRLINALNEGLNEGLHRKLTLVSAAAGFGQNHACQRMGKQFTIDEGRFTRCGRQSSGVAFA